MEDQMKLWWNQFCVVFKFYRGFVSWRNWGFHGWASTYAGIWPL